MADCYCDICDSSVKAAIAASKCDYILTREEVAAAAIKYSNVYTTVFNSVISTINIVDAIKDVVAINNYHMDVESIASIIATAAAASAATTAVSVLSAAVIC